MSMGVNRVYAVMGRMNAHWLLLSVHVGRTGAMTAAGTWKTKQSVAYRNRYPYRYEIDQMWWTNHHAALPMYFPGHLLVAWKFVENPELVGYSFMYIAVVELTVAPANVLDQIVDGLDQ